MATVLTLRTALATLLASDLGTYTLANGSTTPAISVRDQGGTMAAGTTVEGIEVVITAEPELEPVAAYANEAAFSRWILYLVDWSGANAPRLQAVAEKIIAAYPRSRTLAITVPRGVGPRNQIRVDIRTDP